MEVGRLHDDTGGGLVLLGGFLEEWEKTVDDVHLGEDVDLHMGVETVDTFVVYADADT